MMAYNCDKLLTFQAFTLLLSTDSIYTCFMVFILFSSVSMCFYLSCFARNEIFYEHSNCNIKLY